MSTLIHERSQAPMQGTDAFLSYLADWLAALEPLDLAADWAATGVAAENVAVFVVDMVNGFCHAGPLAGERVKGLIAPVQGAIERCHSLGVRHFCYRKTRTRPMPWNSRSSARTVWPVKKNQIRCRSFPACLLPLPSRSWQKTPCTRHTAPDWSNGSDSTRRWRTFSS